MSVRVVAIPQRKVRHRYEDPFFLIWHKCLEQIGWRLERSSEVFASWDGDQTLTLGAPADLDPDDHLGQLILHELCHAMIEGSRGHRLPDWGLENIDHRHLVNELSCHRLQSYLSDQYKLRGLFAVTTDWRPYFDQIPLKALSPQREEHLIQWAHPLGFSLDKARELDQNAIRRVVETLEVLGNTDSVDSKSILIYRSVHLALKRSAAIADLIEEVSPPDTLWGLRSC